METYMSDLYTKMQAQLQEISQASAHDLLYAAEQSYYAVTGYLKDLKDYTKAYEFRDLQEEIRFFKEVKPKFLKEVVYFMKIFDIESGKPVGGQVVQRKYYKGWITQLQNYFKQNKPFHMYYRMDKSHLDDVLFVREPKEIPLMPNYSLDADPGFSNIYSFKLAKMQAYEELIALVQSKVYMLANKVDENPGTTKRRLSYVHTGAQAIELGYSLWASGAFGTDVTIKEVFDWIQYCFNIRINHYYGYMQSMRIRKKTRTPYLHLLDENLIRYMDSTDEHPRYN